MAEDWLSVQAEVAEALKEVSSDGAGFPVTLKAQGYADPLNPEAGPTDTLYDLLGVQSTKELKDASGTFTGQTMRVLSVNATGVAPLTAHKVAIGVASADVDGDTVFESISDVSVISPAGVPLLYKIYLEN